MALNIQSGLTWAEIRAELNNKVFDKNGDTLLGTITDVKGNEALKIDADNQTIISYGIDGKGYFGEELDVGSGDIKISIPKGTKRGVCIIETGTRLSETSGYSLNAMLQFNTESKESKLIGWLLSFGFSQYIRVSQHNSSYASAYIDNDELNIHIGSSACQRGTLNIYWEVW